MAKNPLTSVIRRDAATGKLTTYPGVRPAFGSGTTWLAMAPHDDDIILGMGLLVLAALDEGIELHCCVVSDGSAGYSKPEDRAGIVARRKAEMEACMRSQGVPADRIHWLGFPDSDLPAHQGRRKSAGDTGIAHAITRVMRKTKPNVVFCPTYADLHPDHRVTASETDIAIFHAAGAIWLELGEPLAWVPERWDYGVYCPFPGDPDLEIRGTDEAFAQKLEGISCFASQPQIDALVAHMKKEGAVECFQKRSWQPYSPNAYAHLFRK